MRSISTTPDSVRLIFSFAVAALSAGLLPGAPALAGTVTWDGGGDGTSWHDPLNWDTDTVPLATDEVVITLAGTYTVELAGDAACASLSLGAGSNGSGPHLEGEEPCP